QNEFVTKGETDKNHLDIIFTGLPGLAQITGQEPFTGWEGKWSPALYIGLESCFKEADNLLGKRSSAYTYAIDKTKTELMKEIGKDGIIALKRDHHNLFLEELVLNSATKKLYRIADRVIVPRVGQIYLEPASRNGRAPFYSHEKILGTWHIPTLWYNMGVMALMAVLTAMALFFQIPARFMKKGSE
ncbi:MAG: hypothetical protein WC079_06085, partial [Bacteroidales bacterium]